MHLTGLTLPAIHRLPYRRCFLLWIKVMVMLQRLLRPLEVRLLVMIDQRAKERPSNLQCRLALVMLAVRLPT
jgi:hypothetical protein